MENLRPKTKNILVAIDNSIQCVVNAYLLKKQNFKCFGISFYLDNDELNIFRKYFNAHQKHLDLISTKLDISIKKVDVSIEFKDQIIDPMIACLIGGKHFNLEHSLEQFFIEMLYRNRELFNCDFISVSLRAKVLENQKFQSFDILEGNQTQSDQSCFLSGLKDEILNILVLGGADLRDNETQKLFGLIGLSNQEFTIKANRPSLLELLANKEFIDFLKLNIPASLTGGGVIKDNQTSNNIGEHAGLYRYMVGMVNFPVLNKADSQIDSGKTVVKFDVKENVITVDNLSLNMPRVNTLILNHLSISNGVDFNLPLDCFIKVGHGETLQRVDLFFKTNHYAQADFYEPYTGLLSVGQIVYFYSSKNQKAKLIGSALIEKTGDFIGPVFVEAPYGISEKTHINKYENNKSKKTYNYL